MIKRKSATVLRSLVFGCARLGAPSGQADDTTDVATLKKQVQGLQKTVQQLQQTILTMQQVTSAGDERIQRQAEAVRKRQAEAFAAQIDSPLDKAMQESETEGRRPLLASQPEGL